jgi:hypothetical protein
MKKENNTETVNEYMRALEHPLKTEIEFVRSSILNASNKIAERVKWNAPSFYYKKDMAAFNLRQRNFIHLVFIFPNGLIENTSGLLEGDYIDRRMIYFQNMEDIKSKKTALEDVVREWVKLINE